MTHGVGGVSVIGPKLSDAFKLSRKGSEVARTSGPLLVLPQSSSSDLPAITVWITLCTYFIIYISRIITRLRSLFSC